MRAEQTVSEMVAEALARQAEALANRTDQPFEEAFEQVLETPAGRQLAELADGPHRHEKAAAWQVGLLADREAQRPAHLRELDGARSRYSWLGRHIELVEGTDGREEYHALVRERFAILER